MSEGECPLTHGSFRSGPSVPKWRPLFGARLPQVRLVGRPQASRGGHRERSSACVLVRGRVVATSATRFAWACARPTASASLRPACSRTLSLPTPSLHGPRAAPAGGPRFPDRLYPVISVVCESCARSWRTQAGRSGLRGHGWLALCFPMRNRSPTGVAVR